MYDQVSAQEIYEGTLEMAQLNVSDLPYEPTADDWADYERHLDSLLDAHYEQLEAVNRELQEYVE